MDRGFLLFGVWRSWNADVTLGRVTQQPLDPQASYVRALQAQEKALKWESRALGCQLFLYGLVGLIFLGGIALAVVVFIALS